MTRGDEVFRSLMDLDLILQDGDKMVELKMFLASVTPDNPSLVRLHGEILAFKARIEAVVAVASPKVPR